MLTIGYIGNGKSTNRYHLPFSLKNENIHVKTIYSRRNNSVWDKIPNVNYVDDPDRIFMDKEIQLVVICTPLEFHYGYAKLALENGKHVLVEKPFTQTSDQARELFAYAREKNLFIQCYQNRRFDSDFLTVQRVINSGILGDILEVEMHYDYFRPEIPMSRKFSNGEFSYLYGHGCHTIDQALSFFGNPNRITYDVRQLLGKGHMNDYFDLDLFYDSKKVSIKSSYFRLKERPSFVVYGKKGVFVKQTKDRQEEHLKLFYMPSNKDFGIDLPEHYGILTFVDDEGKYHEEKVISEVGDYGRVYDGVYESIIYGKEKMVKDEETIRQIEILEEGINYIDE
ncbi:Gfo/Idh/MocA family oxidoreductase [Neobacillus cucumis]|uniref:Gfo/Idh/MocA family oxidoreductase n=1 Tax=Neobacillus cucumis TaxID=1740721 RepID=UPI002E21F127|nr:Gfo/Idh/MocA family oxidoreductase [Neobacillus cucumis]